VDLSDFLRKQAEQILALARKTADPELRRELEKVAQDCLTEIEAMEKTKHFGLSSSITSARLRSRMWTFGHCSTAARRTTPIALAAPNPSQRGHPMAQAIHSLAISVP